jgi:methylmalonyl-CoA/ethylmalonyl-CoA epimerase
MPFKLDHIGFVVEKISEFEELFRSLGFDSGTDPVPNPFQKVTASFIDVGAQDNIYIEVLEPTGEDSPISNFLRKRGGGLHHLCFEVDDIEKTAEDLVKKGFRMVVPPEDCVAYDVNLRRRCTSASKTAFFMLSQKMLVELIEKGR